ncbi:hypothetical protein [Fictibacillus macauensis]|nr:hypothetical protein [Fictibacillus macauensis]
MDVKKQHQKADEATELLHRPFVGSFPFSVLVTLGVIIANVLFTLFAS